MGDLILIRHGQANSGATTEEDYDRLSALGQQQATWLGDYLRAFEAPFDRVLTGGLRRHLQTADAMGEVGPAREEDPRWNEMDYYTLSHALNEQHGVALPTPDGFAEHAPKVLNAWKQGEIEGAESYSAFAERITDAIAEAAQPGRRVICVTSGGVIGTVIAQLLGLETKATVDVLLPIRNSSIHQFQVTQSGPRLAKFNAHPHLDSADRHHARTTY